MTSNSFNTSTTNNGDSMNLEVIPRLAKGNWRGRNIGVGCIMNLKSWEQNEPAITDAPHGYSGAVRQALIAMNDTMCTNTTEYPIGYQLREECACGCGAVAPSDRRAADLLCSECVLYLLQMADLFENSLTELVLADNDLVLELYSELNKVNACCASGDRTAARRYMDKSAEIYRRIIGPKQFNPARYTEAARRLNGMPPFEEIKKVTEKFADYDKAVTLATQSFADLVAAKEMQGISKWANHTADCLITCDKIHAPELVPVT